MKILIIIPQMDSNIGGMERFVIEISSRLSKLGHSITVLTGKSKKPLFLDKVTFIRHFLFMPKLFKKAIKYIHLSFIAKQHLKKNKYDAILAMGSSGFLLKDFVWRASGNPLVRKLRHLESKSILSKIFTDLDLMAFEFTEAICVKKAKYHMFPSIELKSLFEKKYRFVPKAFFIPCSGVTIKECKETLPELDKIKETKILCVGGLSQELKGSKVLKDALGKINKEHKLIVVGDINIKLDEPIVKNIVSLGNVDSLKMPILYNSCDILVYPSITEGFPNTVLEAASFGMPIVVSKLEGIKEYFADGKEIMLVDKNNSDMLAEKINLLINSKRMQKTLAKNVKKRVSLLNYDHFVDSLIGFLKDKKSVNLLKG